MVLPFKIFEKLMKAYLDQRDAEEELCEGFKKYNGTYGPILELPLTSSLPDLLNELYEDSESEYPLITWWLFDVGEVKNYKNSAATIVYAESFGKGKIKRPGKIRKVETLFDLWQLSEEDYAKRKYQ